MKLDFSSLAKKGSYEIEIPGMQVNASSVFIDNSLYRPYPAQLIGFMRQLRCGYNPFSDMLCHQLDGRIMDGPMKDSTYVDVSGGWHDAGDQLKYLITASNATARMLMSYQQFPDSFSDKVDDLGKKGANKIADVLDEARWGLDWIHKLHLAPDQLIHQVGDDRDHTGFKLLEYDPSNYGWGKNSYRVAIFCYWQTTRVG